MLSERESFMRTEEIRRENGVGGGLLIASPWGLGPVHNASCTGSHLLPTLLLEHYSAGALRERGWNRAPAPSHHRTHFNTHSSHFSVIKCFILRALLATHKSTKKYGNISICQPSWWPSEWPLYNKGNKYFHSASEIKVLSLHSSEPAQHKLPPFSRTEWSTCVVRTGGCAEHNHRSCYEANWPAGRGFCLQWMKENGDKGDGEDESTKDRETQSAG